MKKTTLTLMASLLLLTLTAPAHADQRRARSSWYIGFGLGGGGGWVELDQGDAQRDGGAAAMFKVGAVISENLLIGYETAAWHYQESSEVFYQLHHHDVMLTWFPLSSLGLFVKGGAGLGYAVLEVNNLFRFRSRASFDLRLGAGYEFRLGRSFNLGVEVVYGGTFYKGESTGDTNVLLTLTWY